jgi:hypothetical protein
VCDVELLLCGQRSDQLPRLRHRLAAGAPETLPGSLRGRAQATYQPVLRQADAKSLLNLQTNRPQFQHDPASTCTARSTRCA